MAMESSSESRHPLLRPASSAGWGVESAVRSIAGSLILIGLALSFVDRLWLWLVAFVGLNLFQSGITGWCLMSNLLRALRRPGTA